MEKGEIVNFWLNSSKEDREAAEGMFQLKHYHWSLFLWQLSLEKLLKGLLVKQDKEVLYTHDLKRLAKEADLDIHADIEKKLNEITTFNLDARYDDYKLSFFKKATREYSEKWISTCKEIYIWIQNQIQ